MQFELTERQRDLISRGAMFFLSTVLLLGSWKCFVVAKELRDESLARQNQTGRRERSEGGFLPFIVACTLLAPGGFFFVAAIVPTSLLGKIFRPPIPRTSINDVDSGRVFSLWKLW